MNIVKCILLHKTLLFILVPVPEDLEVGSVGESWIVFSWSLFPGEVPITEQIILVIGGGSRRTISIESNATSANVTGLQSGTLYTFRVVAVDINGNSGQPSALITATTTTIEGIYNLTLS